jgi:group I intron endonuclease
VGSSANIEKRVNKHFHTLSNGTHDSSRLSAACAKHGVAAFTSSILEECSEEALIDREQFWLTKLKPRYNRRLVPATNAGLRMTPEERVAHSEYMRRACDNPAARARLTATVTASWADPVQRAARIESLKAAWTPAMRARVSARTKGTKDMIPVVAARWEKPGAHERASAIQVALHAARGPVRSEEAVRVIIEATPGWRLISLSGLRNMDTCVVRCDAHDRSETQLVRDVIHKGRGCKLCGYARSSEKQIGRPKKAAS